MRSSPASLPLTSANDTVPTIRWAYLLVGLATAFALWISVVQPPDGGYFTTDEQFIADSGVFMLYGATPRCLDWPGIPMVLVFYLLALGQCAINLIGAAAHGLSAVGVFEVVDKTAYAYLLDRVPLIVAGRLVQVGLVSGLLVGCVRVIYRSGGLLLPTALRLPLVAIICLQYDILTSSPVIRPEAPGYALFALTALLVLFGNFPPRSWRQPAVVLLLVALLISQRLLFVFTFPFLLGGLLCRIGWRWSQMLAVAGTLLVLVLLTMPFLLTDTFVIAKAFAGGMLMKVNGSAQSSFFNWDYINSMVLSAPTVWQLLLLPIGAWALWKWYPNRGISALLLGNLLLLTVSIFHSSTIYITHTLPLRTMSLFLLAYAVYGVYQQTRRRWLAYGLTGLIVLSNLVESVRLEADLLRPSTLWQVAAYLKTLPANTPVLIESEFDNLVPRSKKTLLRELEAIQNPAITQQKYDRQFGSAIRTAIPVALRTSLSEDERLAMLQRQVQAQYTPTNQFVDLTFFSPTSGFINYFVEQPNAFAAFANGQYTYLITHQQLAYPLVTKFDQPSHSGNFYVYKTPAPH